MIRPAQTRDIPAVADVINDAAEQGLMLHRSYADLYENVRDFQVAVDEDDVAIGICGLRIMWANLAEVYSLAVHPGHRGKKLGSRLVEACVEDARRLGIRRLMTLTYEKRFFERLQFTVVDRQTLPLKVWSECLRCAKNQACDEIAMVRVLEDVEAVEAPKPQPPVQVVVPVQLDISAASAVRIRKMDEMH